MLDPQERSQRGGQWLEKCLGTKPSVPETFFQSTWQDYIFAEIWSRPGLDIKSRFLIAIAGAAATGTSSRALQSYIYGAITSETLSVPELREAAVHCGIYHGWTAGEVIDATVTDVLKIIGMDSPEYAPLCAQAIEEEQRLAKGAEEFHQVMTFPGPPPVAPYFEGGILNFVFGEVWHRQALAQRDRRWLTLVGVCDSSADSPIRTHIYGAMASGNCSFEEMQEFVLQYAVHAGWPKASFAQGIVYDMAEKINKNLTWDGQVKAQ